MPWAPLKPCSQPGCGQLTEGGKCPKHRKLAEQARGSARKRGYTTDWERESKAFLGMPQNRRCCCGCDKAADMVDHEPPHRGDMRAFWDRRRWRPMNSRCHSRKTAERDGGFGRPRNSQGGAKV